MGALEYSVLQTTLEPPAQEKLREALRAVPGMVAYDAEVIVKDAYGVLLRRQPLDTAATVQRALASQGIETELVPEKLLPPMPTTKFVKRVEITPAALMIYDPVGRKFPIEWGHFYIVAAGMVQVAAFTQTRVQVQPERIEQTPFGYRRVEAQYENASREGRAEKLLLDLVLSRGVARLSIEPDNNSPLLFGCLGERKTGEPGRDFALLVQDILQHAPNAAVNRGAHYLREQGNQVSYYPTKNAFYEEIQWLLWQMARPKA